MVGQTAYTSAPMDNATPPNRVRELRTARGWSQHRLAVETGVTTSTIYELERGQAPRIDTARAIARIFDLPIEDVFPSVPA